MRHTLLFVFAALSAALTPLAAQSGPVGLQDGPGASNRLDVQIVGGLTTYYNQPHASAGGLLRVHMGAWSVLATGTVGSGSDYESLLLGAGLGRDLLRRGDLGVSGFAGAAYYRDTGGTGITRTAPGLLLGAVADYPLGPLVLSAMLSDVIGRYGGDEYVDAHVFYVPRLTLAIGL